MLHRNVLSTQLKVSITGTHPRVLSATDFPVVHQICINSPIYTLQEEDMGVEFSAKPIMQTKMLAPNK